MMVLSRPSLICMTSEVAPPSTVSLKFFRPCFPQHTHLPVDVTAAACRTPPSQCTNVMLSHRFLGSASRDHSLPSLSTARLCSCPAAMTLIGGRFGTAVGVWQRGRLAGSPRPSCPLEFHPQLQTFPLTSRASCSQNDFESVSRVISCHRKSDCCLRAYNSQFSPATVYAFASGSNTRMRIA